MGNCWTVGNKFAGDKSETVFLKKTIPKPAPLFHKNRIKRNRGGSHAYNTLLLIYISAASSLCCSRFTVLLGRSSSIVALCLFCSSLVAIRGKSASGAPKHPVATREAGHTKAGELRPTLTVAAFYVTHSSTLRKLSTRIRPNRSPKARSVDDNFCLIFA